MTRYTGDYTTQQIPLQYVAIEPLHDLTRELLRTSGLTAEDADIIADALVTSELRNLQGQGQGVRRVKAYLERIDQQLLDPTAPFEVIKESPALTFADAHNGPGTVVAVKAMRRAVEKAGVCGIGATLMRHSTHFGSASYSASQALAAGCIGVSMTNAGPEMAPWGGIDPVLGTNPWAVAIPTGDGPDDMPIILDMAITMAGKGMMRWLMRDGQKMPLSWAITRDGRFTDDPAAAMDGTLLPMGEYKGYGLSLITDVITGVLGGGGFGTLPYANPAHQDVSHQFIAYAIDWFMPRAEFYARLQEFITMIKQSATRPDVAEILLPGELEWRRMQEKRASGVPLDPEIFFELRDLAQARDVAWPFDG
ncbi:MAG: Ldh family oxidoreductase [Caldilineaceae bacterium]|nr:Ldh family oxidoreductase [Caldilineaceae bacterium]